MEMEQDMAIHLAATTHPDGERYVLALECPADGRKRWMWIGASQMCRASEHRATGRCACPQCGRHLHVAITGDGVLRTLPIRWVNTGLSAARLHCRPVKSDELRQQTA